METHDERARLVRIDPVWFMSVPLEHLRFGNRIGTRREREAIHSSNLLYGRQRFQSTKLKARSLHTLPLNPLVRVCSRIGIANMAAQTPIRDPNLAMYGSARTEHPTGLGNTACVLPI